MNTSTYNTTSRLVMAPVAILLMLLLWLLVNWEVGLGGAWLVLYLAPDLMAIFSKRWRVMKAEAEREEEKYRRELLEELDRKYKGVELPDELLWPPRNPNDYTACSGMVF